MHKALAYWKCVTLKPEEVLVSFHVRYLSQVFQSIRLVGRMKVTIYTNVSLTLTKGELSRENLEHVTRCRRKPLLHLEGSYGNLSQLIWVRLIYLSKLIKDWSYRLKYWL